MTFWLQNRIPQGEIQAYVCERWVHFVRSAPWAHHSVPTPRAQPERVDMYICMYSNYITFKYASGRTGHGAAAAPFARM